MSNEPVRIDYNHELKPLETALAKVKRAGDFVVHGALELPMPKVEVEGVGVLSFPVPASQVATLIELAVRAPFGRGEETVLDTSVRKVWQFPPEKLRIGGKSWAANFDVIIAKVAARLGCERAAVSAELYKLLVYDEGGFFRAHRDTEKSGGMFGTLVVVLPAVHRGGELVVRHAGREVVVDLSCGGVSEVVFAAFYADCEHEVRPVTSGNRVCLIFNLIQSRRTSGQGAALTAPDYEQQIAKAAAVLEEALRRSDAATTKIAWLLEHQYSPAGLAFSALKSADSAKAKVLVEAAVRANCAAHLAIVHIEESGPAEPTYSDYEPRGRGRYYDEDDDEEDVEEDASDDEFDVVEVSESWRYVDQWVDPQDRAVVFGKLPLEDGELLPQGALDNEKPDQQRLMEATGNEGASFERSYHRAAVVIWHRERYADVLLQAGVGAALPWLKERVDACASESVNAQGRREVAALARRMIDAWKDESEFPVYPETGRPADRAEMLDLLGQFGEPALVERFITAVVIPGYDGSENTALVAHLPRLSQVKLGELAAALLRQKMRVVPGRCVELLLGLIADSAAASRVDYALALQRVSEAAVTGLDDIATPAALPQGARWQSKYLATLLAQDDTLDEPDGDGEPGERKRPVDSALVVNLLTALGKLATSEVSTLREAAARKIAVCPAVFDPVTVVVPAIAELWPKGRGRANVRSDEALEHLWTQSVEFLLRRSELPPAPPKDWRQEATLSCRCVDCRQLQIFVRNPLERVHRFSVRKDRRQHLHGVIDENGLEMTHVTERKGSPQTLVCTKDRRGYQRRCDQYRQDIAALESLAGLRAAGPEDSAALRQGIDSARARRRSWVPG